MTDQQIKIAIAEACGWKAPDDCAFNPPHRWRSPLDGCCYNELPNYPNDLNAMHEAEMYLIRTDGDEYVRQLKKIRGEEWGFASDRERAEAFVRTVGKWKD